MTDRSGSPDGGDDRDEPPRVLAALGRFGVYLAVASLSAAVFGVVAIYAGFQPYGNVATTLALAGVSVAMILAMLFQAYVGDVGVDR